MKSTEFISDPTVALAEQIRSSCQPFLEMSKGMDGKYLPIYRGVTPLESNAAINNVVNVRPDREPKNTYQEIHVVQDLVFNKLFGVRYRSQSIFVVGNSADCKQYGSIHCVFPIGNFDYCWSPNIFDLYIQFPSMIEKDVKKPLVFSRLCSEWIADQNYRQNGGRQDFLQAIVSSNEIMIHCSSYILVSEQFREDVYSKL